jgi:hypothetical protein
MGVIKSSLLHFEEMNLRIPTKNVCLGESNVRAHTAGVAWQPVACVGRGLTASCSRVGPAALVAVLDFSS